MSVELSETTFPYSLSAGLYWVQGPTGATYNSIELYISWQYDEGFWGYKQAFLALAISKLSDTVTMSGPHWPQLDKGFGDPAPDLKQLLDLTLQRE